MNEQLVLAPEALVEAPRQVSGSYLPRLVRAARAELAARLAQRANVGASEDGSQAPWQVDREQRLVERRRQVGVSLIGYNINPFDPNGR